jgi:hypothetical protein
MTLHPSPAVVDTHLQDLQSASRKLSLDVITYLIDTCDAFVYAGESVLDGITRAVFLLGQKGIGVRNGFIIGRANWDFPVGSLDFEHRERVIVDCLTGLFCLGTVETCLTTHTVYAMDTFPIRNACLVGMEGPQMWSPENPDKHGNALLTCLVSWE